MTNYKLDENNIVILVDKSKDIVIDEYKQTDKNIVCGMVDNLDDTFSNPEIILTDDQIRQQKLDLAHSKWDNLKIGYNHDLKTAYQVKFGSELNEELGVSTYIDTTLYNASDLENIVEVGVEDCLLYCDESNMNILSSGLAIGGDTDWDGSLGKYHIEDVELSVILRKAKDIVQIFFSEVSNEN